MEEVVKAIEKLAEKDILDYLLIIAPILVSVVAIIISIATSWKQNKIALYEQRYRCLAQVKRIISFSEMIKENKNPVIVLELFDALWGSNVSKSSGDAQIIRAKYQIEIIKDDVEQITFLFKHSSYESFALIIQNLHTIMLEAIDKRVVQEHLDAFCKSCDNFYVDDFKQLTKRTKLK